MTRLILATALGVVLVCGPALSGPRPAQAERITTNHRLLDSFAQGTMRDLADRRMARKEGMKRGGGMHGGPKGGMMRRQMHRGQRHHVN